MFGVRIEGSLPLGLGPSCVRNNDAVSKFRKVASLLHPPLAALGEDGLEVAFEEGAGVLEVLFGVGFGGGEARKRFVEQADDPLLFGQRGDGNLLRSHVAISDRRIARAFLEALHLPGEVLGEERVEDERWSIPGFGRRTK